MQTPLPSSCKSVWTAILCLHDVLKADARRPLLEASASEKTTLESGSMVLRAKATVWGQSGAYSSVCLSNKELGCFSLLIQTAKSGKHFHKQGVSQEVELVKEILIKN